MMLYDVPAMITMRCTSTVVRAGLVLVIFALLIVYVPMSRSITAAQPAPIQDMCPQIGLQALPADITPPSGVIITAFDRRTLWAVNVDRRTRFPLENTRPCATNCRLSPDARWLSYLDPQTAAFSKMRLDGAARTPLLPPDTATEVFWWRGETLLVWSPEHKAALYDPQSGAREPLHNAEGAISIQPGGRWALKLRYAQGDFYRVLVNLRDGQTAEVQLDIEQANGRATAWSPDGTWLAYTSPVTDGMGLFGVRPEDAQIVQWTALDGAVRIGGQTPAGGLSWSPDGNKIAFWLTPLIVSVPDATPEATIEPITQAEAYLHVLDIQTGETRRYCGFSVTEYTPQPPRLVWSPDSAYLAFKANPPDDPRGYLLVGLNVESGVYSVLSEGIYPSAEVVAWGLLP
jgi:Tol biopolymer transport system component